MRANTHTTGAIERGRRTRKNLEMTLGISRSHHPETESTDVISQIQPKREHTMTYNTQTQRKKQSKSNKRQQTSLFKRLLQYCLSGDFSAETSQLAEKGMPRQQSDKEILPTERLFPAKLSLINERELNFLRQTKTRRMEYGSLHLKPHTGGGERESAR